MSATLSYDLKKCLPALVQDNRWNVLTVLILHSNIRNRCFVGLDTIAALATHGNRSKATRAKKWLESHGAFEIVPFDKRVADELALPPRQHIYQLTGELRKCKIKTCLCQKWEAPKYVYLYTGTIESLPIETIEIPPNSSPIETFKSLPIESLPIETVSSTHISTKREKTPAPKNGAAVSPVVGTNEKSLARPRDPIFDAVALHVFSIDDGQVQGGRVAKISNWLNGKFEGRGAQKVGFISRPAEVAHIEAFAADCKKRGITPPLDLVKFVENWRAWASRAHMPKIAPEGVVTAGRVIVPVETNWQREPAEVSR